MKRRIGEALKNIRLAGQREQSEIAEALGVHPSVISRIETGQSGVSMVKVVLWAEACKVDFLFVCKMVKLSLDDKK